MMKRHVNPDSREASSLDIPSVTEHRKALNDERRLSKGLSNTQRIPIGKKSRSGRVFGGILFAIFFSLYLLGTCHVLLNSALISMNSGKGKFHDFIATELSGTHRRSFSMRPAHNKPRILGHYFASTDAESYIGTEPFLSPKPIYDNYQARILRGEFMNKYEIRRQRHLLDSDDYESNAADTMADMGENCVAQYEWQEAYFPTCNFLMEIDMTNLNHIPMFEKSHYNNRHDKPLETSRLHSYTRFLSHGYWRDVWAVDNLLRCNGGLEETVVLKTMRYEHDYVTRNYDRHRRDAVAMERLTASINVMNIYASCANSGLFEYASGGSLKGSIWTNFHEPKDEPWTSKEKLIIAYQGIAGLADLHNFAKEGVPAIAHTDLDGSQYVYVDSVEMYKLNDFNRARFLAKNNVTNDICTYEVGNNPGSDRSPEEYKYEPQTEKVDIYSYGNVVYSVLTGQYPFEEEKESKAQELIASGERPSIPIEFRNSTDPFDQALNKVIKMAWIQDPKERATARKIQTFIKSELKRLGVEEDRQ